MVTASIHSVPDELRKKMEGASWNEELSPSFDELRLLELPFWGFDEKMHLGNLVTSAQEAETVIAIFARIAEIKFPIFSMQPICHFDGDDDRSMAANNTSCFNTRKIRNTDRLSDHSYGRAIDINPLHNPAIRDGVVRPPEGQPFVNKRSGPGVIVDNGPVVEIFAEKGWKWGGHWTSPIDYHHFYRREE